jgi:pyruvate,orthophosphate dikinase
MNTTHLRALVARYKTSVLNYTGETFPTDPWEQLFKSIHAVCLSWFSDRSVKYRDVQHIHGLLGTAVNVQAMVYGNYSELSGSGVVFSRNPSTGYQFCDLLYNIFEMLMLHNNRREWIVWRVSS